MLARNSPTRGYLRLLLRLRPGQAVVEVLGGTLLPRLPSRLVVAHFRTAFPSGAAGEVVAQEGTARLQVALPASPTGWLEVRRRESWLV